MDSLPQAQSYVVLITPEFFSPLKPHSRHKQFLVLKKIAARWSFQRAERAEPVFRSAQASSFHPYAKEDELRHERFLLFEEKDSAQRCWFAAFQLDPPGPHPSSKPRDALCSGPQENKSLSPCQE